MIAVPATPDPVPPHRSGRSGRRCRRSRSWPSASCSRSAPPRSPERPGRPSRTRSPGRASTTRPGSRPGPRPFARRRQAIRRIEDRTGAQVVVYTQSVEYGITGDEAKAHARALGEQWGVGRNGFNDGLVVMFDIDPSGRHGQVAIVGGDGFRSAYVDDAEAQRIIDQDDDPACSARQPRSTTAALLAASPGSTAETTPERAANLSRARTVNAILGVILAPLLGLGLIAFVAFHWLRYGRDPVYLDDPSILMPAPPDGLTAATGALVYDGATSRRALTTALLDLASRGQLAFQQEQHLLSKKVGILTSGVPPADAEDAARRRLNARRPIGVAEAIALNKLRELGSRRSGPRGRRAPEVRQRGVPLRRCPRGRRGRPRLVPGAAGQGEDPLARRWGRRDHRRRGRSSSSGWASRSRAWS